MEGEIYGLHDNDMLIEIKRELARTEESKNVTSEQVLAWVKEWKPKKLSPQL